MTRRISFSSLDRQTRRFFPERIARIFASFTGVQVAPTFLAGLFPPIIDTIVHLLRCGRAARHVGVGEICEFPQESAPIASRTPSGPCLALREGEQHQPKQSSHLRGQFMSSTWRGRTGSMSKVSRVSVVWLGVLLAAGYFNVHAARLQEAAGPARSAQATPSPDTSAAAQP